MWEAIGALALILALATLAAAQPPRRRNRRRTEARSLRHLSAPIRPPSTRGGTSRSAPRSRATTSTTGTPARSRDPAARLRHARQHLRHPAGRARRRRRAGRRCRPPLRRCASICSSARRQRRCRAAPPTSRGPTSIATSGRPTARTCSRSADGLQTDFGKFASNLGYETNYAKDNNQFSRAYLFNFLPFYHSGLRVTLPVDRQGLGDVHADQRHPADRGLQRLQVESRRGDRQAGSAS